MERPGADHHRGMTAPWVHAAASDGAAGGRTRRRRYTVVIAMLVVSAAFSLWSAGARQEDYEVRLREFPLTVGEWRGQDVVLGKPDMVYAVLETSAVLSRIYRRPGGSDTVDLLVTYFERGHRGFHPPEVSFVAAGNTISRSGLVRVGLGDAAGSPQLEANMFLGTTPTGQVLFLYWFGVGDRWTASYLRGSVQLLWNAVWRRPSAASMVRIALPVVDGDVERTRATAQQFSRVILPLLPEYLTERPRAGGGRRSAGTRPSGG
jgi:EpsI family protein